MTKTEMNLTEANDRLDQVVQKHTPNRAEMLANKILKASGSNLKNYTMEKSRREILIASEEPYKMIDDLVASLKWALDVISIADKNAPNIDWSIGHFGRKTTAQAAIAKAKGE